MLHEKMEQTGHPKKMKLHQNCGHLINISLRLMIIMWRDKKPF